MFEQPQNRLPGSDPAATGELPAEVIPLPTAELPLGPAPPRTVGQEFPLEAGAVVEGSKGRYRLLQQPFGRGGQSWVYRAEAVAQADSQPGHSWARERLVLKVYREAVDPDPAVLGVIADLDHPGLLRIVDHGWYKGRFCEVMPWAEGGTLLDRVEAGGPLGVDELRRVVELVNSVLEYCHGQAVIHGDIKPANLFYLDSARTRLVVGDFGVAAHLRPGESLAPLERFTPGFLGPEAYGGDVGRESDYHALGVTLIWLATGRSPWAGREGTESGSALIRRQILSGALPVPDGLPERFRTLIAGLLVKERERRWGSREVQRWLDGKDVPGPRRPDVRPGAPPPSDAEPALGRAFLFEGVYYTAPVELARAMGGHWVEGRKRLYRGHVREWARTFNLDLANGLQDIEEEERDQNRGVYRMLGLLHPSGPYCYSGLVCETPADLGRLLGQALACGDSAIQLQVVQALESGTVEDWLRRLGRLELADRIRRLTSRGLAADRRALWAIHYELCPGESLELDGVRLQTPADLAAHLAADWRGRAELTADPRTLAWLSTSGGLEVQVAEWLRLAGDYRSDPARGLAAFITLIYPGASTDPAVLSPFRGRVEYLLARVKEALEEHVFRGDTAREIEREGRALAQTVVDELSFTELRDLDWRARAWLEACRRAEVEFFLARQSEGILTRRVYREHVAWAAQLAAQAVARVEALRETIGWVGGPMQGLNDLRAQAERARDYEDHLTVVEAAVELVEKIHRQRSAELARVEARRSGR